MANWDLSAISVSSNQLPGHAYEWPVVAGFWTSGGIASGGIAAYQAQYVVGTRPSLQHNFASVSIQSGGAWKDPAIFGTGGYTTGVQLAGTAWKYPATIGAGYWTTGTVQLAGTYNMAAVKPAFNSPTLVQQTTKYFWG